MCSERTPGVRSSSRPARPRASASWSMCTRTREARSSDGLAELDQERALAGAAVDDRASGARVPASRAEPARGGLAPVGARLHPSARRPDRNVSRSSGAHLADRHRSSAATWARDTKPPRLGPSGPTTTAMSPASIDRADAVGAVEDIRRMQPGLAAVAARPDRGRTGQAHAGAVGLVVHGPLGSNRSARPSPRQVLGRAVGPGTTRSAQALARTAAPRPVRGDRQVGGRLGEREHVAGAQRTAAQAGGGEHRPAAHHRLAADPAPDEHVRAQPDAADRAELRASRRGHGDGRPLRRPGRRRARR